MPPWVSKTGFVLLCLAIPILWGWLVNLLFVHWARRRPGRHARPLREGEEVDDETFIDYEI